MKPTTLALNGVTPEMVDLIARLVDWVPYSRRRQAMGDVTLSLLNGKKRVAESVLGWNRSTVDVGINEFKTGICCLYNMSSRPAPKTEIRRPDLMADIHATATSTCYHFNVVGYYNSPISGLL